MEIHVHGTTVHIESRLCIHVNLVMNYIEKAEISVKTGILEVNQSRQEIGQTIWQNPYDLR